jgi:hypothetical protein
MAFIGRLHPLLIHFPIAIVAWLATGSRCSPRERWWP